MIICSASSAVITEGHSSLDSRVRVVCFGRMSTNQTESSTLPFHYYTKSVDCQGTEAFRLYFMKDGVPISPFHDIPLWVDKEKNIINMIVEIPKGGHPKLEVSKIDRLNPIKQDVKKGKLRFVHDAYPFNYGAAPQTWENPNFVDVYLKTKGDNDPLDIVDIGSKVHNTGDIIQVKLLGVFAMIDEGETDWKVLTIDVNDENAAKYNDSNDIPEEKVKDIFTFLRDYKIPDGNPPNKFGYDDKLQNKDLALRVVNETNAEWRALITGATTYEGTQVDCTQLSKDECPSVITAEDAEQIIIQQYRQYLRAKH